MTVMSLRSAMFAWGCSVPAALALVAPLSELALQAQGTPETPYSCATSAMATPGVERAPMDHMASGTPVAGMAGEEGLEVLYIDMMIPHHVGIIAMADAALPRLSDARLQGVARSIIATQSAEIPELRAIRDELTGEAAPAALDHHAMTKMMDVLPGMGSMAEMEEQMDAAAQVQAICAARDPDRAFIALTIPHHEMAIVASEAVLAQSDNEALRELAARVIVDQQAEIDALREIERDR